MPCHLISSINQLFKLKIIDLPEFDQKLINPEALGKLLDLSTLQEYETEDLNGEASHRTLYEKGKAADFLTIVLQGKVQVTSGSDRFISELGPFSVMGLKVLSEDTYISDFTAVAAESCQILKIKKGSYVSALKATEISQ